MSGSTVFREHVQISALGYTNADQLGADFFQFRFESVHVISVLNETELARGQTSSLRQFTKVIKS